MRGLILLSVAICTVVLPRRASKHESPNPVARAVFLFAVFLVWQTIALRFLYFRV